MVGTEGMDRLIAITGSSVESIKESLTGDVKNLKFWTDGVPAISAKTLGIATPDRLYRESVLATDSIPLDKPKVIFQEHTVGLSAKDLRKDSNAQHRSAAAKAKGVNVATRWALAGNWNSEKSRFDSVVTVGDRENKGLFIPDEGVEKTVDVEASMLIEQDNEVALIYELLVQDFESGINSDKDFNVFLEGTKDGLDQSLGRGVLRKVGGGQVSVGRIGLKVHKDIIARAVKKAREYELSPEKSVNDFFPDGTVRVSGAHIYYTALTGDFSSAVEMAKSHSEKYQIKNPEDYSVKPQVYKRIRQTLENYAGQLKIKQEEIDPKESSSLSSPEILSGPESVFQSDPKGWTPSDDIDPIVLQKSVLDAIQELNANSKDSSLLVYVPLKQGYAGGSAELHGYKTGDSLYQPFMLRKSEGGFVLSKSFAQHWITGSSFGALASIMKNGYKGGAPPNVVISPYPINLDFEHYASGFSDASVLGDRVQISFDASVLKNDRKGTNAAYLPEASSQQITHVNVLLSEYLTGDALAARKSLYSSQAPGVPIEFYYMDEFGTAVYIASASS